MRHYIAREKWPRCKTWEKIVKYKYKSDALADFNGRITVHPDSYRVGRIPQGKIIVQCIAVDIIEQGTI